MQGIEHQEVRHSDTGGKPCEDDPSTASLNKEGSATQQQRSAQPWPEGQCRGMGLQGKPKGEPARNERRPRATHQRAVEQPESNRGDEGGERVRVRQAATHDSVRRRGSQESSHPATPRSVPWCRALQGYVPAGRSEQPSVHQ